MRRRKKYNVGKGDNTVRRNWGKEGATQMPYLEKKTTRRRKVI